MKAGEQYVRYYEDALSGRLRQPPLLKPLYGVSWRILHRCTCAEDSPWHPEIARITSGRHLTLGLMSEVTAFRLPTTAFFGALCALIYLFFVEALGSRWGAWTA